MLTSQRAQDSGEAIGAVNAALRSLGRPEVAFDEAVVLPLDAFCRTEAEHELCRRRDALAERCGVARSRVGDLRRAQVEASPADARSIAAQISDAHHALEGAEAELATAEAALEPLRHAMTRHTALVRDLRDAGFDIRTGPLTDDEQARCRQFADAVQSQRHSRSRLLRLQRLLEVAVPTETRRLVAEIDAVERDHDDAAAQQAVLTPLLAPLRRQRTASGHNRVAELKRIEDDLVAGMDAARAQIHGLERAIDALIYVRLSWGHP